MMFLPAAFMLGVIGSLHCVGMCGPIALAIPVRSPGMLSRLGSVLTYNSGRAITYSVMGIVSGLLGKGLALSTSQNMLSLIAGILILLLLLFPDLTNVFSRLPGVKKPLGWLQSGIRGWLNQGSLPAMLGIGILNGLLPCGLVYTALTAAMATGNAINGALFMGAFGLGTIPLMGALMISREFIPISIRTLMRKAVPVFVCITACLLILRGLSLGIPYVSPAQEVAGVVQDCCKR